jgi:hypothetical protein
MTSQNRGAELSKGKDTGVSDSRRAKAGRDSVGVRALLIVVLTPALILFMSRKDVGRAAPVQRADSASRAYEQWPAPGFDVLGGAAHGDSGRSHGTAR